MEGGPCPLFVSASTSAVPLQEDHGALVAQQPQPAQFFVRKRLSEKSEVLVDERVGGEELRRGDRARARHIAADHAAVDTPPLVAVKVQSRRRPCSRARRPAPRGDSRPPLCPPPAA